MELLSLFIASFISSTLYPMASEAVVVALILQGGNYIEILTLATLGNTLGSITTYFIAYYGDRRIINKFFKKQIHKTDTYKIYIKQYGVFLAFFSFLPIIGDIFVLALGFGKYNITKTIIAIALGKLSRYTAIIYIALLFK